MQLFEAIVEANHRAVRGEAASLDVSAWTGSLPVAALTCIDPRLNALLPGALGLPPQHFIWLRNAGNIITGPLSSTMRSLALACAVKGAKEIVIIGHSDCLVAGTNVMKLTDAFRALGVERAALPENLQEYFGLFASERQNVMKACEFVRQSPLTGPKVPVHGLLVDVATGQLEWIVNGYQALTLATGQAPAAAMEAPLAPGRWEMPKLAEFQPGEMKFPEMKIGDAAALPQTAMWEAPAPAWGQTEAQIGGGHVAPTVSVVESFQGQVGEEAPKASPPPVPPVMETGTPWDRPKMRMEAGPHEKPPRIPPAIKPKPKFRRDVGR